MSKKTFTRSALVKRLAKRFPMLLAFDVRIAVDEIVEAVTGSVINDQRVEIRGFGAFSLRKRKPRVCRNPKTGEVFPVGTRYAPYFKPATQLRLKVMEMPVAEPIKRRRNVRQPLVVATSQPTLPALPERQEDLATAA